MYMYNVDVRLWLPMSDMGRQQRHQIIKNHNLQTAGLPTLPAYSPLQADVLLFTNLPLSLALQQLQAYCRGNVTPGVCCPLGIFVTNSWNWHFIDTYIWAPNCTASLLLHPSFMFLKMAVLQNVVGKVEYVIWLNGPIRARGCTPHSAKHQYVSCAPYVLRLCPWCSA